MLGAAVGYVLVLPQQRAGGESASRVTLRLPAPEPESPVAEAPAAPPSAETGVPKVEAPQIEAPGPPVTEAATPEDGTAGAQVGDQQPGTGETPGPALEPETADAEAPPAPEPPAEAAPQAAEAAPAQPAETQQAVLPRAPPPEAVPLWRRNSQPFEASDERPRIAIVLTGLGLSSAATEAAIKQLPAAITLSFTPYSRRLNEWVALARVNGHEVMLDLPMEPTSYPDDDPGPQALLTALSAAQNLERLDWALARATGYVGVATIMGSRFITSESHLVPILEALKTRGLLFLDNRANEQSLGGELAAKIGLPSAVSDRFLDRAQASRVAVDARLIQLERIARAEGQAVAMGRPYPVTIERLREWAKRVEERGLVLAPISAVVERKRPRKTAARNAGKE